MSVPALASLVVTLSSGCVRFQPQPLDPARSESKLRARALGDEGLRAYVELSRGGVSEPWPPAAWDLDALTLVAFYYHADLDLARAETEVAEARIETAGGRPNPVLSFVPQYTTNAASGVTPWTLGFALDVPIETAGKRAHRVAGAEHLGEGARLALADAAWHVRSRLRRALADHLLAERELAALRDEEAARRAAASLIERRLSLGEVSRPDLDTARSELASTSLSLRRAEGRLGETAAALAAALGVPSSALRGVPLAWADLDSPPSMAAVASEAVHQAGLVNRLDLRRALEEYAATESLLQLEIAKQYPDLHLGPVFDSNQDEPQPGVGLSLELPMLNQNQGPIGEAEARRREARARVLALQARILGDTDVALARYCAAQAELIEADQLQSLLDAQVTAAKRALAVGAADRLVLEGIAVQRAVVGRAQLGALARTQAALGLLEDAVQRPLGAESDLAVPQPAAPAERGQAGAEEAP